MSDDFGGLQPPSAPAPGWYPNEEGRQQWWDGSDWTDRFQDDGPSRTGFIRTKLFVGLTAGIAGFALGLAAGLIVTAGDDQPSASSSNAVDESPPSSESEAEPTEEPSSTTTKASGQGDSGGLSLKVLSVKRSNRVTYAGGTSSEITPDGNPKTVTAKDGSYYLYVATSGLNGTKEPIDLTCSYPIDIAVLDKADARYTPIEGLDQIKGNPGCNEMTQPGQKFKETFIFLLPKGAEASKLTWFAVSSDLEESEPATIKLPAP
jgi:hypothetical protein